MSTTILTEATLVTVNCGECGGVYGIGERYHRQKREKGGTWTCPYCKCSWGYIEGENARLKKKLADAENATAVERSRHDQTKSKLDETKRSLVAQKAATTRFKNRVAAGTCPCCDQSFEDLAAHMKVDHPEFATAAD